MLRSKRIHHILSQEFMPLELRIADESDVHQVPLGAESHFKVIIVSDKFHKLTLIARHRAVNSVLRSEFDNGLHALSMFLYTPEEWFEQTIPDSPACRNKRHINPNTLKDNP